MEDVFVAIYTNEVKRYCDELFFNNIKKIVPSSATLFIVDNSLTDSYLERIKELMSGWDGDCKFKHVYLPHDESYRFQKSVLKSLKVLEHDFLESECKYFLIIETDVIPSKEDFEILIEDIRRHSDFGAIGGLYYNGIHNRIVGRDLVEEDCVFSGFTVYKREVIEKIGFRWDEAVSGCFPDSFMKHDLLVNGYKVGNDHRISCMHLKKTINDR